MKAVGYRRNLPIDHPEALEELEVPTPSPGPHDILVRVLAVSVNPVDTKIRRHRTPADGHVEVLGWDAVGIVEELGTATKRFARGDRIYYAGAINRPGSNSEFHVVDARIASLAPASLTDEEAAALPLTSLTAYELLFERLRLPKKGGQGRSLMIVGGAGGVGSMLIQLARRLTQLQVIATASRPETRQWCLDLGAHAVIDHGQPLSGGFKAVGIEGVDYVAALTHTKDHYAEIVESLKPQGALACIDDMDGLDAMKLKAKSLSLHWELMFTRPMFQTPDMGEQGRILAEVASLVDQGIVRSTVSTTMSPISARNLMSAHAIVESGRAKGKVVLAGF